MTTIDDDTRLALWGLLNRAPRYHDYEGSQCQCCWRWINRDYGLPRQEHHADCAYAAALRVLRAERDSLTGAERLDVEARNLAAYKKVEAFGR